MNLFPKIDIPVDTAKTRWFDDKIKPDASVKTLEDLIGADCWGIVVIGPDGHQDVYRNSYVNWQSIPVVYDYNLLLPGWSCHIYMFGNRPWKVVALRTTTGWEYTLFRSPGTYFGRTGNFINLDRGIFLKE